MQNRIDAIYNEVYQLFYEDDDPRHQYTQRDWIFPHHIDVAIELAGDMAKRYEGDAQICTLALILHDTGLVYKREGPSSAGHEERSIEYAERILQKHGIHETQEVLACIKATNPATEPRTTNERIVRTADALSQYITVHFFAKAAFSGDWEQYAGWLERKAKKNFEKICFEKERERARPFRDQILQALARYRQAA